jgi:hypothetical protein
MSSRHFYVANIVSALVWAPMHIFPGVLVGLAIAFGGAHAPELSLAAVGASWIAWSMIKRKTAGVLASWTAQPANTRPDQAPANLRRGHLSPSEPHRTAPKLENCSKPSCGGDRRLYGPRQA